MVREHLPSRREVWNAGATIRLTTMPVTLLQRVARGETAAVAACIDEYGGIVYSLAVRYLRPVGDDVDDAVQEVFTEVWKNADRFKPELGSEAAFISTIARHRLIDRQRRAMSRKRAAVNHSEIRAMVPEVKNATELNDDARRAAEAFGRLDVQEREILWFAIYQGLTQEQIAEAINIPLGTVKTRARRGLMRLREMLGAASAEGVAR